MQHGSANLGSASGTVTNGQFLQLEQTTGTSFNTAYIATVTVGTGSTTWNVTTAPQDTTPHAFSFTNQTGVALSTLTTSNTVTITGITGNVAVSISGTGSPQISINGGAWTTSGTITNGQSLQVELTSSASLSTTNSASVIVGSGSTTWNVTTTTHASCPGLPGAGDEGCVMADGTIYAGVSPDGSVAMYTTTADTSNGIPWNNGNTSGYTTTGQTSTTTGQSNTAHLITLDSDSGTAGVQPHQAAQLCANSTANGHNDWYLPAKDELNVLYTNHVAIGAFSTSGALTSYYWTSTESSNKSIAWYQVFSSGSQGTFSGKFNLFSVRCVRKD